MSVPCKKCGIKLGYDMADDWDKGICGTCPKPRIKDVIVTCTKCGKQKNISEIKLPKGYNPTFIDGYYRCIACFEADELYNSLARERDIIKEALVGLIQYHNDGLKDSCEVSPCDGCACGDEACIKNHKDYYSKSRY
jgi:hypothetical protein